VPSAACGPKPGTYRGAPVHDPFVEAQRAQEARAKDLQDRREYVQNSCTSLLSDKALDPIAAKLPVSLNADDVTFPMMALTDTPTDDERVAIVELVGRGAACDAK
jgi:hypothetical protein